MLNVLPCSLWACAEEKEKADRPVHPVRGFAAGRCLSHRPSGLIRNGFRREGPKGFRPVRGAWGLEHAVGAGGFAGPLPIGRTSRGS